MNMEEKESSNFCSSCGAPMRDSDTFCPSCGKTVGGSAPSTQQYGNSKPKSNRLIVVAILAAIWAFIALAFGLYIIFATDSILAVLDSTADFWDTVYEYGLTRSDIANSIAMLGAIIAASGALAAITAVLAAIKKFYVVALITCILSALIVVLGLVGIVGLIIAYLIYRARDDFVDSKKA